MRSKYFLFLFIVIFINSTLLAQKSNKFPEKIDPLYVKMEMFTELMLTNNWNEGAFMHSVIYPPAGLNRSGKGRYADSMDETTIMLVVYSYKYVITKNKEDRYIANQLFDGRLKTEAIRGVPGLMAPDFYKTEEPLWKLIKITMN
jgi:hypothetical protein